VLVELVVALGVVRQKFMIFPFWLCLLYGRRVFPDLYVQGPVLWVGRCWALLDHGSGANSWGLSPGARWFDVLHRYSPSFDFSCAGGLVFAVSGAERGATVVGRHGERSQYVIPIFSLFF